MRKCRVCLWCPEDEEDEAREDDDEEERGEDEAEEEQEEEEDEEEEDEEEEDNLRLGDRSARDAAQESEPQHVCGPPEHLMPRYLQGEGSALV